MKRTIFVVLALLLALVSGASLAGAQSPTIADIVRQSVGSSGEFRILLAAIEAADPAVLATLSDPNQNLTVFAPTNQTFRSTFRRLGLRPEQVLGDQALVTSILLYHVVPGARDAATLFDLSRQGWPNDLLTTLEGTKLELTDDNGTLIVNSSWVSQTDIRAANGIIHVINGSVLLPSEATESALADPGTPAEPADVQLGGNDTLGAFLIGANGFTLYTFVPDDPPGVSNCNGNCAVTWPPLTVAEGEHPTKADNLPGQLDVIVRQDGRRQVTYNGDPLYYFANDLQPGDTNGEGIGGVWFVARP